MPAGKYLYRVLRDDEDSSLGLTARHPEAVNAPISSHVNGLIMSPYISTTASEQAAKNFHEKAVKRWIKLHPADIGKQFTIVRIDKEQLLMNYPSVEVYDLTDEVVRNIYLGYAKVQNFAKKDEEVLVKGFIPPECIVDIYPSKLSNTLILNFPSLMPTLHLVTLIILIVMIIQIVLLLAVSRIHKLNNPFSERFVQTF